MISTMNPRRMKQMNVAQLKQLISNLDDETVIYVIDNRTMYPAQSHCLAYKGEQRVLFTRASSTRTISAPGSIGQAGGAEQQAE